jgi:hypothetical protein
MGSLGTVSVFGQFIQLSAKSRRLIDGCAGCCQLFGKPGFVGVKSHDFPTSFVEMVVELAFSGSEGLTFG